MLTTEFVQIRRDMKDKRDRKDCFWIELVMGGGWVEVIMMLTLKLCDIWREHVLMRGEFSTLEAVVSKRYQLWHVAFHKYMFLCLN